MSAPFLTPEELCPGKLYMLRKDTWNTISLRRGEEGTYCGAIAWGEPFCAIEVMKDLPLPGHLIKIYIISIEGIHGWFMIGHQNRVFQPWNGR